MENYTTVETVEILSEEVTYQEIAEYVPLYGIVDDQSYLIDITFEETEHYIADIPEDMTLEEYKEAISLDTWMIKVEGNSLFYEREHQEVRMVTETEMNDKISEAIADMTALVSAMFEGAVNE